MSDTDDTDALLSCDPGGGLDKLLGATMKSVSPHDTSTESKTSNESNTTAIEDNSESQNQSSASKRTKKKNAKKKKVAAAKKAAQEAEAASKKKTEGDTKDTMMDVSDYFNSEGELMLSGLSQFEETSNSRLNDSKTSSGSGTDTKSSSGDKGATSSSATVIGKVDQKISNVDSSNGSTLSSTSSSALVRVPQSSVPLDIQDNLKKQILDANKNNPKVEEMLEGNTTKLAYGVLNLNLNDLSSFASGLSRTNIFPRENKEQKPKVSTFVPSRNEKGEEVYSRQTAPNFRTSGGYKPPTTPRQCRDLTDDQIREEVRKMYAFPFLEDGEEEDSNSGKEKSTSKSSDSSSTSNSVNFNFLDGSPVPNEFGKGKTGKPTKRKLLPLKVRSADVTTCGDDIMSIPDLGFGAREEMFPPEVKEPAVEKKTAYVATANSQSSSSAKDNGKEKSRFSFGFGEEENMLSPIRPTVIQSVSAGSQRFHPSPDKKVNNDNDTSKSITTTKTTSTSGGTSTSALASISETEKKQNLLPPAVPTPIEAILGVPTSTTKKSTPRRIIRKAATKYRAMAMSMNSPRYEIKPSELNSDKTKTKLSPPPQPQNSTASDLMKILSEVDLPPEEIDALLENFSEDDGDFSDVDLFDEATIDGNVVDCLQELKLDLDMDVFKRGKEEISSELEKLRREQCEKELRQLQEEVMTQKQQNAVLEGTLKRRNMMLVQITMAFNKVCKEWKKFDQENRLQVKKLQHDQKVLAAACKHGKERIAQYEKELHKTLELADSFKMKVFDVQKERDDTVQALRGKNDGLENEITKLKDDVETLRNERDATLRALRETQVKLDEGKGSLENMESQLKELQEQKEETSRKYDELLQTKAQQEANYYDVVERRNDLEAMVMKLTSELNMEKSSNEQIRREVLEEADRKTRAEAERLHDYYNNKVQEILKSATEEAARAEKLLKEQIKRAAMESERKVMECKEKHQRELEALRVECNAEIEKLKRENLHRQLLISSTVKQLQMSESSNLDMNSLTNPHSQLRKDLFDSLKPQSHLQPQKCAEEANANSVFKSVNNNNPSSLTRFTLDHLPSRSCLPDDPLPKNLSRFKTSTPIECQSNLSSSLPNSMCGDRDLRGNVGGGGDYRKHSHSQRTGDISFNSFLEKVSSKSSSSSCETETHAVSHLLEAPVKPEKEQVTSSSSGLDLDPQLQKCIQDLLRSYADKFPLEHKNPPHFPNNNHRNKDNVPLSDNANVVNNNKSDPVESSSSNSYSQSHQLQQELSCRTESRSKQSQNPKGNKDTGKGQAEGQSKPPWK